MRVKIAPNFRCNNIKSVIKMYDLWENIVFIVYFEKTVKHHKLEYAKPLYIAVICWNYMPKQKGKKFKCRAWQAILPDEAHLCCLR